MNIIIFSNAPIKKITDTLNLPFSPKEGWVSATISMLQTTNSNIYYFFPQRKGENVLRGTVENIQYYGYPKTKRYDWEFEDIHQRIFTGILKEIPDIDVIHIMGTEYGHSLSAVLAAEECGLIEKVVISIQGMVSVYAKHTYANLPTRVIDSWTIRDFIRQNNLRKAQKKMELRGTYEIQAIQKVHHIMGRTDWDRACTMEINPEAKYHFCNETLRQEFYSDSWTYEKCRKHSIFMSQGYNSIKGMHYMLEAMNIIKQFYPEVKLYVTGNSPLCQGWFERQKRPVYINYLESLIRKYELENNIEFLGSLNAEEMKEQYLLANVFASPSSIENSPNSVGEAMILGTPVVSSDVGGVKNMLTHNEEGFLYQHDAPYMLAFYVMELFENGEKCLKFSRNVKQHAEKTHDANRNLNALIDIYRSITQKNREVDKDGK